MGWLKAGRDKSRQAMDREAGGDGTRKRARPAKTTRALPVIRGARGRKHAERPKASPASMAFLPSWRHSPADHHDDAFSTRRAAIGIEITSHEIRAVALSYSLFDDIEAREIRIDDVALQALPPGVVMGADILDSETLSTVLRDCLGRQRERIARQRSASADSSTTAAVVDDPFAAFPSPTACSVALGLCPSVVTRSEVGMDELMRGFHIRLPSTVHAAAFDVLEPWVRTYAQRLTGIDAADICVDWYRPSAGKAGADLDRDVASRVIVAAAERHYLDVRRGIVNDAGAHLGALTDSAAAALHACRYIVTRSLYTFDDTPLVPGAENLASDGPRFALERSGEQQSGPTPSTSRLREGVPAHDRPFDERAGKVAASALDDDDGMPIGDPDEGFGRRSRGRSAGAHRCGRALAGDTPRFAALWLGESAQYAWTFDAFGGAVRVLPLPQDVTDDNWLQALAKCGSETISLGMVAGEPTRLARAGGVRAVGSMLRCPVIEFDASNCCIGPASTPDRIGLATAVPFGLALRELLQ